MCSVHAAGYMYAWGSNYNGQINHAEGKIARVSGMNDQFVIMGAAGEGHSIALTRDGTVYTWGAGQVRA